MATFLQPILLVIICKLPYTLHGAVLGRTDTYQLTDKGHLNVLELCSNKNLVLNFLSFQECLDYFYNSGENSSGDFNTLLQQQVYQLSIKGRF